MNIAGFAGVPGSSEHSGLAHRRASPLQSSDW